MCIHMPNFRFTNATQTQVTQQILIKELSINHTLNTQYLFFVFIGGSCLLLKGFLWVYSTPVTTLFCCYLTVVMWKSIIHVCVWEEREREREREREIAIISRPSEPLGLGVLLVMLVSSCELCFCFYSLFKYPIIIWMLFEKMTKKKKKKISFFMCVCI